MRKVLALIMCMILAFGTTVCVSAQEKTTAAVNGSNWMSAIDGATPVTAINMPGTHDSASRYALPFNMISRTQSKSIPGQLYSGVRYFDMRFELLDGEKLIAVHSITNCKRSFGLFAKNLTAEEIVTSCIDFLKANPKETILFQVREDDGDAGVELYNYFYKNCIENNSRYWYTENRIPTLDEVRGKIVLLRVVSVDTNKFNDSSSGINFSGYPYIGGTETIDFRRRDIKKLSGETYAQMYVQDSYKIGGDAKWEAVTTFLESDLNPSDFNICLTSGTEPATPFFNAKVINPKLEKYNFKTGKTYGIIAMDFATEELCEKIYMTNENIMTNTPEKATEYKKDASYALFGRTLALLRNVVELILSLFTRFV